jgi:beta-phosphoglucomutase-like phosphatase (HAD superfamily)
MRRIMWVLEKIGIESYFLHHPEYPERWYNIVSANDITHHKPDPEVWIRCAEILAVSLADCLVIEDGLPGLTGAKACGARGIYYQRFCRPEKACLEISERTVESFSELIQ